MDKSWQFFKYAGTGKLLPYSSKILRYYCCLIGGARAPLLNFEYIIRLIFSLSFTNVFRVEHPPVLGPLHR